jgi:S-(hydroxymethyl)glutathione dehydrogenase/alcohol dehydrogenase
MLPTGLGIIFNTVQATPSSRVAIFGCGGIGLSALLGTHLVGCKTRVAIDINPSKLELAKALGATHTILASTMDPLSELNKIGPIDIAIEASGSALAMEQALSAARSQGGIAVIAGNAPFGQHLRLDPKELNQGKRLLGTWGGDNLPDQHFPKYCTFVREGKLPLTHFTTQIYPLSEIHKALSDLEEGKALRPLIDMSTL